MSCEHLWVLLKWRRGQRGDWFSLCEVFHLPSACSGHLLPNTWHDINRKMKTSYWHPASASPSSSASCLSPSVSHFLFLSLFHTISLSHSPLVFPALSFCFIPHCFTANPFDHISISSLFIIPLTFLPHALIYKFWLLDLKPTSWSASLHASSHIHLFFIRFPSLFFF